VEEAVEDSEFGLLERGRERDELSNIGEKRGGARAVNGDEEGGGPAGTDERGRALLPFRNLFPKKEFFS